MKKSKLITGLSAAFVSAMALMSCSTLVKARSGVILKIDGVEYTADMLFNDQKTPAAAEAKFNAVYKVAVKTYFKKDRPGYSDMEEINRQTKVKMNEQKATAKSNADKNGTSYEVEWKKILKENGVDTTKALQNKFEYEFQKEKFEDRFYEDNYDNLRNGKFPGADKNPRLATFENYFDSKQPYHIRHILVKLSNIGDDNTTATITSDEAIKLHNVITSLAEGTKSFERVSELYSDDEAAKKDHASLGIMSRDTSFVDDFKLGIYLYESFFGSSTMKTEAGKYEAKNAKKELFGEDLAKGAGRWATKITKLIDPTNTSTGTDDKVLGIIPYEAAVALGEEDYNIAVGSQPEVHKKGLAKLEFEQTLLSSAGISKNDFKDKYLPRNVIFNKYFNKHNIMVITPTSLPTIATADVYSDTGTNSYINKDGEGSKRSSKVDTYAFGDVTAYASMTGFSQANPKNDDTITLTSSGTSTALPVLRDDNGRVILVFRSGTGGSSSNDDSGYQGIHFVVIERSPFIGKEYDSADESKWTKLNEYYTQYYPNQSTGSDDPNKNHPTYNTFIPHPGPEEKNDWKHTFVNYIMDDIDPKNKKDRADTVKSELKKCDGLNTYLYEYLVGQDYINFTEDGEAVKVTINNWIDQNYDDRVYQHDKGWDENWQKYYYSLAAKTAERKEYEGASVVSRLTPEACAVALTQYTGAGTEIENLRHMFGAGGVWHE